MPSAAEIVERARSAKGDSDIVEELVPDLVDEDDERRDELREELALLLLRDFGPIDRHLIRVLTEIETHRAREEGGCGDALYALCFMLFWLGNEEDQDVIVAAKESNMDTGAMIDSYMLTMRKMGRLESIDREKYPYVYAAVIEAMKYAAYESDEAFRDSILGYFGLAKN